MESVLSIGMGSTLTLIELVRYYHNVRRKLKYKEICQLINEHHGLDMSLRKLRYILSKENLNRKRNVLEVNIKSMISNELCNSLCKVGYRQMTESLSLKYGVNVSKETVRRLIKEIDPEGVEMRKRGVIKRRIYETYGPGDIFHLDGNDKLKRWGFAIHGCVDEFSRKLLWLVVCTTNNDPLVVGNFFLNCVKRYQFVPRLLRMDAGNENIYCEDLQVFFSGRNDSFLYASSTRNQRIEAFWSRLKKFKLS